MVVDSARVGRAYCVTEELSRRNRARLIAGRGIPNNIELIVRRIASLGRGVRELVRVVMSPSHKVAKEACTWGGFVVTVSQSPPHMFVAIFLSNRITWISSQSKDAMNIPRSFEERCHMNSVGRLC